MKLKNLRPLRESEDKTYSFVTHWTGQTPEDFNIEPFNVKVDYYAEPEGLRDGSHLVQVTSLTTDQAVRVDYEKGVSLDKLKEIKNLNAVVVAIPGSGVLLRLKNLFPNANVFNLYEFRTAEKLAWELFHFLEDNQDEDVIFDIGQSDILFNDMTVINLFKALLTDQAITWKSSVNDLSFTFKGRIIIYSNMGRRDYPPQARAIINLADGEHEEELADHAGVKKDWIETKIHDTLLSRCVLVDMTQDRTFPRGSRVQDIPGWDQSMMKHFEELAEKDFKGHD